MNAARIVLVLVAVVLVSPEVSSGAPGDSSAPVRLGDGSLLQAIGRARSATHACQKALSRPLSRSSRSAERSPSLAYRGWVLSLWRARRASCGRALAAWRRANVVPEWPWGKLAGCESGRRWDYSPWSHGDRPYSGFDGGVQFHPGTWSAYRSRVAGAPSAAYLASPAVQISVARLVLDAQGWGAWPKCSRLLGLR